MHRLKSPLTAQLELTEACNNACIHCYNYWRYLESGKRVCSDSHEKGLSHFQLLLDNLIAKEVRTVTFTGGEPFLRRDVLFDLIAAAKKGEMKAGVNTNGALITEDDVSHLKDVGTDFLLVSLLSDTPDVHNKVVNSNTHGSTSKAIADLAKAGLSVTTNMVVSSQNWDRVRQTALYIQDLGVKDFCATPVMPCPLAEEHPGLLLKPEQVKQVFDDLLWVKQQGMNVDVLEPLVHCMFSREERLRFSQFLDRRSCAAGISDMAISPDGDARPCILATESCGNLITDGWEKVWGNLAGWCSPNLLPDECLNCAVVDECGGGCRIAALSGSGEINGRDPYMTSPLGPVADEATNDQIVTSALSREAVIAFPSDVAMRDEEFGSVVFKGRNFIFLDNDGTKLLKHLRCRGSFTMQSIVEEFDIEKNGLASFLDVLLSRGFLNSVATKGGE